MNAQTQEVVLSIIVFSALFGIAYVFLMTRYRERMAMIERGVDASLFTPPKKSTSLTLKFGMFFVGVALGILMGHVLHYYYGLVEEVAFLSMVFLLGGLGLIANFLIERRLKD